MEAEKTSQLIADSDLSLDDKLSWHLEGNHYPPIDKAFIPIAKAAIHLANEGDWEAMLAYPNGLLRSVEFTVDGMHLDYFLNE